MLIRNTPGKRRSNWNTRVQNIQKLWDKKQERDTDTSEKQH